MDVEVAHVLNSVISSKIQLEAITIATDTSTFKIIPFFIIITIK